jgi:hypothetical protein
MSSRNGYLAWFLCAWGCSVYEPGLVVGVQGGMTSGGTAIASSGAANAAGRGNEPAGSGGMGSAGAASGSAGSAGVEALGEGGAPAGGAPGDVTLAGAAGAPDGGTMACVPETPPQFCARLAMNCGLVDGTDNCGSAVVGASCGSCQGFKMCGGGGSKNVDCSKPSQKGLPEKQWTCFEWEFDGVGNQMHLWLNGALVGDADVITTGTQCVTPQPPNNVWQAPDFANVTIGWLQYQQSSTPIDVWMDDLVIATQRVGCPAP